MFFERELRLTEAERRIIRVLSTNPYASTKEIRERAGVSEASVSRSLEIRRAPSASEEVACTSAGASAITTSSGSGRAGSIPSHLPILLTSSSRVSRRRIPLS